MQTLHWSTLQCIGSLRWRKLCLKLTGFIWTHWFCLEPTERVATKGVERDLEGGAERGQGQVGDRGQGVVGHDGEHKCAANHVTWNRHIALSHWHQFSVSGTINTAFFAQDVIHKLPKARFSRRGVMWLCRWLLRVMTRMVNKFPIPPRNHKDKEMLSTERKITYHRQNSKTYTHPKIIRCAKTNVIKNQWAVLHFFNRKIFPY